MAFAVVAIGLLASWSPAAATGPRIVDLGTAAPFAVLAGGGISDAGPSHLTGDVGAYPRPAVSSQVDQAASGTVHRGGEAARLAQVDLAGAYAAASNASATGRLAGGVVAGLTVPGGVYAITIPTSGAVGSLVLDGGGDPATTWIFQVASGLDTEPDSAITLANGAQACNVFWQVGGATRLGARSAFAGTILAAASVTVGSGVHVDGRVLATTDAVSLDGDTIVTPVCGAGPPAAAPAAVRGTTQSGVAAAPTSPAGLTPARDPHAPAELLLVAAGGLLLAVLLGEPRRGRRASRDRW